jgi:hypothetical protein
MPEIRLGTEAALRVVEPERRGNGAADLGT